MIPFLEPIMHYIIGVLFNEDNYVNYYEKFTMVTRKVTVLSKSYTQE